MASSSSESDSDDNSSSSTCDEPSGWSSELVVDNAGEQVKVPHMYLCAICQDVMKRATSCGAGHSFCEACLSRWQNKKATCPTCRKKLLKQHMVPNLFCREAVGALNIRCPNPLRSLSPPLIKRQRVEGCPWFGPIDASQDHAADCGFVFSECPHDQCCARPLKKDVQTHAEQCSWQKVACRLCAAPVAVCQTQSHESGDCPMAIVPCPHGCGVSELTRNRVEEHVAESCLEATVECPMSELGCKEKIKRRCLNEHVKDISHMLLLTQQVGNLQKRCANLEAMSTTSLSFRLDDLKQGGVIKGPSISFGGARFSLWLKCNTYKSNRRTAEYISAFCHCEPALKTTQVAYRFRITLCQVGQELPRIWRSSKLHVTTPENNRSGYSRFVEKAHARAYRKRGKCTVALTILQSMSITQCEAHAADQKSDSDDSD